MKKKIEHDKIIRLQWFLIAILFMAVSIGIVIQYNQNKTIKTQRKVLNYVQEYIETNKDKLDGEIPNINQEGDLGGSNTAI